MARLLGIARKTAGLAGFRLGLSLWAVIEGFGRVPGPGYTDPGVGTAEALTFLVILGIVGTRVAERPTVDPRVEDRVSGPVRIARFRSPDSAGPVQLTAGGPRRSGPPPP